MIALEKLYKNTEYKLTIIKSYCHNSGNNRHKKANFLVKNTLRVYQIFLFLQKISFFSNMDKI